MKTKLLCIGLIGLLTIACKKETSEKFNKSLHTYKSFNLKENVKSIEVETYDYSNREKSTLVSPHEKVNQFPYSFFNLGENWTYTFNKDHLVLSSKMLGYKEGQKSTDIISYYTYNPKKQVISTKSVGSINNENWDYSTETIYKNGLEKELIHKSEKYNYRHLYHYNKDNQLIKSESFQSDSLRGETLYTYKDNKQISIRKAVKSGKTYKQIKDIRERVVESKDDRDHYKVIYKSNIEAPFQVLTYNTKEQLTESMTATFDNHNNPIKIEVIEELPLTKKQLLKETHSFKYQYDAKGNWTSRIWLINDKAKYLTKRKIEYFN